MKLTIKNINRSTKTIFLAYFLTFVLIFMGAIFVSPKFVSKDFLLLQLVQASILGCIAAGQMVVILTGNMDLSVSWTLNFSAVMATSIYAGQSGSVISSIMMGIGIGILIGMLNGLGVAFLRVPSIIFTLGINSLVKGIQVLYMGNGDYYDKAQPILEYIANHKVAGIFPLIAGLWLVVSIVIILILNYSKFGISVRSIGYNSIATFLSGIKIKLITVICFMISGLFSAIAGLLLVGYSGRSFSEMGEPYQMPAIAAVVVGGVLINGGEGSYLGVIAGVLMITILNSGLSIMQMPSAGRIIIFGIVIISMILLNSKKSD